MAFCCGVIGGLLIGGLLIGVGFRGLGEPLVTVRDTITFVDTVKYFKPVAKDSTVVRYETQKFLVIRDSCYGGNNDYRGKGGKGGNNDTFLVGNHAQNDGEIIPQGLSDDRDSMTVEIPITQKVYEGTDYRAWVSGFEPVLDSIYVHPRTTVIRETVSRKPRKWHVGVMGGYGYGFSSKQMEPFVGVGVSYSIW